MRRATAEFVAVVATGAVFLVFENVLDQKLLFIAVAAVAWLAYVALRFRSPGQAREWGFRADNLRPALAANGIVVLVAAAALVAYGAAHGRGLPPAGFFYLIAIYPIWGLVQQFLLCALVCGNLVRATERAGLAVGASALLFGLVHLPDWTLVLLTFAGGLAWCAIYVRVPNLFVQGVAHGLLGALAYYEVLGRDPWTELFGPR